MSLYQVTLVFHSVIRYFVLIAMILSILRSARGWFGNSPFAKVDDKLSVMLLIMAHTQLILGLLLYSISPNVKFSAESMAVDQDRYWLVEHLTTMIIAIVLITLSRITTKKLTDSVAKHKRIFLYNVFAIVLILLAIGTSGRGYFNLPTGL